MRDTEAADGMMKRRPQRMSAELPFKRILEFGAPSLHRRARGARLIAQVIAVAHEGIDGAHRLALLRTEEDERIIEILRAAARDFDAIRVGPVDRRHHAAREENANRASEPSSRPTRSTLPTAGLARSTS